MILSNAFAFASKASRNSVSAGIRLLLISVTAATCMAVGNLSIPDKWKEAGDESRQDGRVVTALTHVDMVIGVNRLLRAKLTTKDLNGSVGDDLVDIHVTLGSATSLEDNQGEMVKELSRDNLFSRVRNVKVRDKIATYIVSGFLDSSTDFGVHSIADIHN